MIQTISRAGARLSAALLGGFVALSVATPAHAAGSSMPWEAPLQSILESIQGPVAKIVAVRRAAPVEYRCRAFDHLDPGDVGKIAEVERIVAEAVDELV